MIANHKGEIPVVVLLIPFIAGITGSIGYLGAGWVDVAVALALLSIAFLALNLAYGKLGIYKASWLGGTLVTVILFLAGWLLANGHNELSTDDHFANKPAGYLVAVINSEPKIKNNVVRFTADVKQTINHNKTEQVSGTILISIKDEQAKKLFYGEQILIPASYTPIDPPFNPAEFNYKRYLANKNIHYQAFLYPKQYVIVKAGEGNPVIAYALQLRQNLVKKLKANMADTNAVAVASTLILGYKADLSNDILQAYSKTGTIHILSVSGGHVAIIYVLLSWMFGFLNAYKYGRVFRAMIIIVLIWGYALLTGFSPAVCRAAVMLSLIIAGKSSFRYINTLNILAVSAFALLLYDPFLIRDVGFQLSYLAVAGLIVFQPIVYNWFSFKNKAADKLWMWCSVSIAAQAITFPLSAYYFHQFPVYFLLSNLLILLPVTIILYIGIALLLLPQITWLSKALGYALEHCILLMNKMLAYIEHAPFGSIGKIWLTYYEYLLLFGLIWLLFYFVYKPKAWLIKTAAGFALLLSVSISTKKLRADNSSSVTFLNVRKHTGIVFKNGSEGVVISDLPATDKNFQYSIQPYLDSSRISNYKVYKMDDAIHDGWLLKEQNLIQFVNKKLVVLNPGAQIQSIPANLMPGYIYIKDNAYIDKRVMANSKAATYIIDGSNSDKYIAGLQQQIMRYKASYRILKRNKSVQIVSNR